MHSTSCRRIQAIVVNRHIHLNHRHFSLEHESARFGVWRPINSRLTTPRAPDIEGVYLTAPGHYEPSSIPVNRCLGSGSVPFASCPRSSSSRKRGAGIQGQCVDWIPASAGMADFSASDGKLAQYRCLRMDQYQCNSDSNRDMLSDVVEKVGAGDGI